MAHSACGQTCGQQVKLCGPSLTIATLSALETGIALIVRRHARVNQETGACIRCGQDPPRGGSV